MVKTPPYLLLQLSERDLHEVAYEFRVRATRPQLVPSPDKGAGQREDGCGTYESQLSVVGEKR